MLHTHSFIVTTKIINTFNLIMKKIKLIKNHHSTWVFSTIIIFLEMLKFSPQISRKNILWRFSKIFHFLKWTFLIQLNFYRHVSKLPIYNVNVATPLWPSVGVKPNTPKVGNLESSGTPECLEFDSKAQNTSHLGVLGVIRKVLKRRYRKWPRIGHLDICSPSYG
jgi:uncharacterized membrane protein